MNAVGRVHQSRVSENVSRHRASAWFQIKPAVRQNGVDFPANLVLMGNNKNAWRFGVRLPVQDEIAGVVGLRFGPRRQQTTNGVFDRAFVSAPAPVGFGELLENGLRSWPAPCF